jgi:hypothetical protein
VKWEIFIQERKKLRARKQTIFIPWLKFPSTLNKKGSYQLFFFWHANKKSTKLFFLYEVKVKTGLTPSLTLWIHFYSFLLLSFSILFCSTLLFASWIKNQIQKFSFVFLYSFLAILHQFFVLFFTELLQMHCNLPILTT